MKSWIFAVPKSAHVEIENKHHDFDFGQLSWHDFGILGIQRANYHCFVLCKGAKSVETRNCVEKPHLRMQNSWVLHLDNALAYSALVTHEFLSEI